MYETIIEEVVHNFDILGIVFMLASLVPVTKIIAELPQGDILKKWKLFSVFILLFVGGYAHIIYQHRFGEGIPSEVVVFLLLFFGSVFVLMISTLSLQTTRDIRRIDVLEYENTTDPLMNIKNRRYLEYKLKDEFLKSKRYATPMAVLMLDIDHFKNVNDTYGHDVGDEVLKSLGKCIKEYVREQDRVARYGGEEIVVICPMTKEEDASNLAERLRKHIETLVVCPSEKYKEISDFRITVSIGVAGYLPEFEEAQEIIKNADNALYRAKNEGRNRVVVYDKSIMAEG